MSIPDTVAPEGQTFVTASSAVPTSSPAPVSVGSGSLQARTSVETTRGLRLRKRMSAPPVRILGRALFLACFAQEGSRVVDHASREWIVDDPPIDEGSDALKTWRCISTLAPVDHRCGVF